MIAPAMLAATIQSRPNFTLNDVSFDQQQNFIRDPARLKALFCTRRAAKSYTGGLYLVQEAINTPGANCLYVALTRDSAKGIIWKDILKDLNYRLSLNAKFNETALTMTLPNGSIIWVTGADSDESEMNKLLGKKYRLAILDEASMFSIDMYQLVYGILKPATADNRGTICLLGTSSNITRGLFYDITTGKEPGWSLHTWTAHDNPHVAKQWQEELDDIKTNRPLFMKTALFQQWYLNKWVIDEDAKVYKFDRQRNCTPFLPRDLDGWHHILGVDLGHSPDPSAFVVGAYHELSPYLFFIHAEKHLKMDVTDVANKIKQLDKTYAFEVKVIDNANKQAVAELNNRHGLTMIPADKTAKVDFINLMNTDFIQQKLQALPATSELQAEWESLVWETDNGKVKEPRKEHSALPNHLTDAGLYLWRYAHQYLFKEPQTPIAWNAQERWEPGHIQRLADEARRKYNPSEMDLDPPDPGLFDFSMDDGI